MLDRLALEKNALMPALVEPINVNVGVDDDPLHSI
jgi:hypothetical protein